MKHRLMAARYCQFILVLSSFFWLITSCKASSRNEVSTKWKDTINQGYNELANPSKLKSFTISDYNSDNQEIDTFARPQTFTVNTKLDTAALYHSWTKDPSGPCTDFVISKKSFYIADYDGNGAMPYELIERKLKVYYNDFIQEGEIISVTNDTLRIHWKGIAEITNYVRWTQ